MNRTELRNGIRDYMRDLRHRAAAEHAGEIDLLQLEQVVFTELRKGYLNGRYVDRIVLFLRGTGCSWVGSTGGCTFCGFWNATNFGVKIPADKYMAQVLRVMDDPSTKSQNFPIVCLYNDGSLLVEQEMDFSALKDICDLISKGKSVRRIVIEAKVIDITENKIAELKEHLNGKELEIAVGFESANELIRDLCINKGFSRVVFESKVRLLQQYDVNLVPLIMVKPPFLTEKQAIEDVIESLKYLEQFKLPRIDLELATIEDNTIMHDLWKYGLYTTPRLWSVIEILRVRAALALRTPLFISPPNYTVAAKDYSSNCPRCTDATVAAIEEYNKHFSDVDVFDSLDCTCRVEWENSLNQAIGVNNLEKQVEVTFHELLRRREADKRSVA